MTVEARQEMERLLDQRFDQIEQLVRSLPEHRLYVPVAPSTPSMGEILQNLLTLVQKDLAGEVIGQGGEADQEEWLRLLKKMRLSLRHSIEDGKEPWPLGAVDSVAHEAGKIVLVAGIHALMLRQGQDG